MGKLARAGSVRPAVAHGPWRYQLEALEARRMLSALIQEDLEFPKSQQEAMPLVLGGGVEGRISHEDYRNSTGDWFRFEAQAGKSYVILMHTEVPGGADLFIKDVSDEPPYFYSSDDFDQRLQWVSQRDGFVFIQVKSNGRNTAYRMTVGQRMEEAPAEVPEALPTLEGGTLEGNFSQPLEVHRFAVDAAQSTLYRFKISDTGRIIGLFGADGQKLKPEVTDYTHRSFLWASPDDGRYELEVVGNDPAEAGAFTLEMQVTPDDFANDRRGAEVVDLSAPLAGMLAFKGDVDWMEFETQGGVTYVVEAAGDHNVSMAVLGNPWAYADPIGHSYAYGARVVFTAHQGELYALRVSGAPTNYGITLTRPDEAFSAEGASSVPVTFPQSLAGEIASPGDVQLYRFDAVAGRRYWFDANGIGENPTIALLAADGVTEVAFGGEFFREAPNWPWLRWTANESGSYYLRIGAWAGGTGTYTLQTREFTDLVGNSAADASPLPDSGFEERIYQGDEDWFWFDAVAGRDYYFDIQSGRWRDALKPSLQLIDTDGATVLASTYHEFWDYENSIHDEWHRPIVWRAPVDGRYYLQVNRENDDESYLLDHWAFEDEGVLPLTLGTPVAAKMNYDDDEDVFQFQATKGMAYLFNVAGVRNAGWVVYDSPINGDWVEGDWDGRAWIAPESRVYWLRVTRNTPDWEDPPPPGTYPYTITQRELSDDFGHDPSEAHEMQVGQSIKGQVDFPWDVDYFTFELKRGHRYQALIHFYGELELAMDEPWTSWLGLDQQWVSERPWDPDLAPTDDGLYLLTVYGAEALGYQLAVVDLGLLGDSITTSRPTQWYRFEAKGGQTYRFETHLLTLDDSVVRVMSADGRSVLAMDDDGGEQDLSSALTWRASADGVGSPGTELEFAL